MVSLKQSVFALACVASVYASGGVDAATLNVSAQNPQNVFADVSGNNAWYIRTSYTVGGQGRSNIATGAFRLKGVDPTDGSVDNFLAFCMSPLAWLRLPLSYTAANTALSTTQFDRLSALANGAWSLITNAKSAGAFQIAVWEIVSESSTLNLSRGNFKLTGSSSNAAKQLAQTWLGQVQNGKFQSHPIGITTLEGSNTQHLLTKDLPLPASVPLPAGLGLLGFALAGLFGLGRARRA